MHLEKPKLQDVNAGSVRFILFNHLIWWMIAFYLVIDSATGFIQLELGVNVKLSLMYKAPLILGMLVSIYCLNKKTLLLVFGVLCCFLIGPIYQLWVNAKVDHYFQDISFSLKLVVPLIAFFYIKETTTKFPHFFQKYIVRSLWFCLTIVFLNIVIGSLGFGFKTYGEGEAGLGTTGYFYAGNELGGLMIIFTCFFLHNVWLGKRTLYLPAAVFCCVLCVMIATKSAVMAAIVSATLIPFINERYNIFKLTKLKLIMLALLAILLPFMSFLAYETIMSSDLFSRLQWAYDEFGLLGLLFSGRQEFVENSISIFADQQNAIAYLFGIGVSGIGSVVHKYSAEVDPVDVLVWFGLTGLTVILCLVYYFLSNSFKKLSDTAYTYAPCVLLVNLLLLASACLSGHIWTSGMLGIAWALINATLIHKSITVTSTKYVYVKN